MIINNAAGDDLLLNQILLCATTGRKLQKSLEILQAERRKNEETKKQNGEHQHSPEKFDGNFVESSSLSNSKPSN
jgi:hypothetical protein